MKKPEQNTNLKLEEIKKYLSGEALPRQKNQVEKKLLNDAFAAEALEGFEAMQQDLINDKIVVDDLKKRLNKRVSSNQKEHKIIPLWQSIGLAASVVLVLGVSVYYFLYSTDSQLVANVNSEISTQKPNGATPQILEKNANLIAHQKAKESKKEANAQILSDKKNEYFSPTQTETESAMIASEISKNSEEKIAQAPPIPKPEEPARAAAKPAVAMAREAKIETFSGQIFDKENNPIAGVSVTQKDANKGTQTDINGKFYLNDLKEGDILQINSVGFNSQELKVKNNDLGKVKLTENTESLSEVVVTSKQKTNIQSSASASDIPANELNQEPIPEVGWNNYDSYLINSLKIIKFEEPLKLRFTVESDGKTTNVRVENNLNKEQTEKVVEAIENGPKWLPARKKGKKIKKDVQRELRIR